VREQTVVIAEDVVATCLLLCAEQRVATLWKERLWLATALKSLTKNPESKF
jgi:hypothetical protein